MTHCPIFLAARYAKESRSVMAGTTRFFAVKAKGPGPGVNSITAGPVFSREINLTGHTPVDQPNTRKGENVL